MAEINEKEILESYNKIFRWLLIVTILINLVTLFIPIFHVDLGLVKVSEKGIKFLGIDTINDVVDEYKERFGDDYRDYLEEPYKVQTSENSYTLYERNTNLKDTLDVDSDFLDSDNFIWKLAIRIILCVIVGFLLIGLLSSLPPKCHTNAEILQLSKGVIICVKGLFWVNSIYTAISVLLCWILLNEWAFDGVMTLTFIPWMFQLAVFIGVNLLEKHMKSALKGEVTPINVSYMSQATKSRSANVRHITDDDKAELLMKYKELLDSGVISEEEFNAKKKELL